jgi:hypothetical protein
MMEKRSGRNTQLLIKGMILGGIGGMLVGLAVGAVADNWRIWVSFGVSLGFAIGLITAIVLADRSKRV